MKIRRRFLSKKEARNLISEIESSYKLVNLPKEGYEEIEGEGSKIIALNGEPFLIVLEDMDGKKIPHLKYLLKHGHCFLPKLVVDRGAIRPIGNGADVMAPGIVRVSGSFNAGDIVVVTEEREIPIAVARAIYSSEAIAKMRTGKVAVNLHHPGDRAWKLSEHL